MGHQLSPHSRLPRPKLAQYLIPHPAFNSIDVARTVELLLLTDIGQQKSLIFGFSDQRVKEWTTLKKYLEGNCLGLLNLAKFIEQSLRFDL